MSKNKPEKIDFDKERLKSELHNHTEDFVIEKIEEIINTKDQFEDLCTCHHCLLDIASYTLNRIPAKYISSPRGSLHAKLIEFEQQVNVDIVSVVTRAIKIISKNPRHD
ncbi:MAG: late competence development ComFB family protein [Bacillota bacterium]